MVLSSKVFHSMSETKLTEKFLFRKLCRFFILWELNYEFEMNGTHLPIMTPITAESVVQWKNDAAWNRKV